jgi:hypothetical protein
MTGAGRLRLRLVAWSVATTATAIALAGGVRGLAQAIDPHWWVEAAGADAAFALVAAIRLAAAAWCASLAAVAGTELLATFRPHPGWVDRLSSGWARRLVTGGMVVTLISPARPAAAASDPPVMVLVPTPERAPANETPPAPAPAETAPADPTSAGDRWQVSGGDHLWSIADAVVSRHLDRLATDAEIAPYWRQLIAVNRGVLADPDNPDLLFAGQVLTLPPLDR